MTKPFINLKLEYLNQKPIVPVWTLYKRVNKKTAIVGLWKDLTGVIHRDNIELEHFFLIRKEEFQDAKRKAFKNGELVLFYKKPDKIGVIESVTGTKTELKYPIQLVEKKLKPSYIKELLNQHGGLTIYRLDGAFLIEIFK